MSESLFPCPSCGRHVRVSSASCPFCAAALSDAFRARPPRPIPAGRLGRAALVAFGAAAVAAGCDDADATKTDGGPADAAVDAGLATPVYGAPVPPPDAGLDAKPPAPAPDAGVDAQPAAADTGAGKDSAGGVVMPVYGAPVPRG